MERVPGRDTRSATSRRRQTSYGWGKRTLEEKGPFGCFLHDTSYVLGDVSVASLPALYYVMMNTEIGYFGPAIAMLVAWITTVVVGALLRGGWIDPLATDVPGWVSMSTTLFGVRLAYYNAALATAAFGGDAAATAVGAPPLSMIVAALVAVGTTLAFPAVAETVCRRYGC